MKILVTGGAGFIGSNVAMSFAEAANKVIILDNISRKGVNKNLSWLLKSNNIFINNQDVRDPIRGESPDVIFHFAAQTGVVTSVENPMEDFDVNAKGTLNILEYARSLDKKPLVIFASTNKVYGEVAYNPINESQPLSFCTPYGCSKGTADQYVRDYYRVYGIPTVVLRMSCIYGRRQMGTERENGWLCHFMRNINNPITVYGDGRQVRDALCIDDYVRLMWMLVENVDKVKGEVFNIGGGVENVISVNDAIKEIGNTNVTYADWRPSDQKYYVSDVSKIERFIGWKPRVTVSDGLERLRTWVKEL